MPYRLMQIDAFAEHPFQGNPAAVCLLDKEMPADWMQAVAQEMNLSETAFVRPLGEEYEIRWFTPSIEVELCGHATLASAHALWETGALTPDQAARFQSASGLLTAERRGDLVELNFPAEDVVESKVPPELIKALNVEPVFAGKARFAYFLELDSEQTLRALQPDFRRLEGVEALGAIVTALSEKPEFDFISRFFAPAAGIDEDPVTGSAHCPLTTYWSRKLNKNPLTAFQGSRRGGTLRVQHEGDRVRIAGRAVTIFDGRLLA